MKVQMDATTQRAIMRKRGIRVITGEVKGLHLKAPPKGLARPTSDLVRSAIFSMLESMGVSFDHVLDLYAGTGALGIEALSRGAGQVDFVERDARMSAVIQTNLKAAGLADLAHVYRAEVARALAFLSGPYDVIFMDPPYAEANRDAVIARVLTPGLVGPRTVVVVEHAHRRPLPEALEGFRAVRQRRYGDTAIAIYRKEDMQ
ncbi:MAG: 16S rRNA (guanine(966)-N(2))-methyltransferase RsmD [Chloroflexi bacterium]|nr:16S rRNA (guanine(966)-N(2))-methyltransferase RsmD [Chloroflexota bacterium]